MRLLLIRIINFGLQLGLPIFGTFIQIFFPSPFLFASIFSSVFCLSNHQPFVSYHELHVATLQFPATRRNVYATIEICCATPLNSILLVEESLPLSARARQPRNMAVALRSMRVCCVPGAWRHASRNTRTRMRLRPNYRTSTKNMELDFKSQRWPVYSSTFFLKYHWKIRSPLKIIRQKLVFMLHTDVFSIDTEW